MTGFDSLRSMASIVWNPSDAFDKLREEPRFLLPLILMTLGGLFLELEARPIVEQLLIQTAPKDISPDQLELGLAYFRKVHLIGIFLSPAIMLIRWACMAWLLSMTSILVIGKAGYRHTFSLVSFSSVILLFESFYSRLIVYLKGLDAIASPRDLDPAIGLSLLIPSSDAGWYTLFNALNPFEAWFVVLLVLGLSKIENTSKKKAALAVVPVWMLLTGLRAGFAAIGANSQ
jgi:hypothetical protein